MGVITFETELQRLCDDLGGRVLRPHDGGYEQARSVFNSMVEKRPAAIARCAGPGEVARALRFAREHGLTTAVRSGGHSVAGSSLCDGGLVVDVRPMNSVEVDPAARVARVGSGCTWADVDAATQRHGLATTGGRVSTTGVPGLALGGGSGWLERKHGLSCDNLAAVELVTAEGDFVRADEDENPDLFWALHGGGGNFGVATALEFRLHPVGPEVLAGVLLWRGERGPEVLAAARDLMAAAPDELGTIFGYITGAAEPEVPEHLHGALTVIVAAFHSGPIAEGEEAIRPLRELAPDADLVGPVPYGEFQCSLDDPPGYRNYWTADYADELPDAAIARIAEHAAAMPRPTPSQIFIVPWGGAVARVPDGATPLAHREAKFVVHPLALWEDPADDARSIAWVRAMSADMKRHTSGGVYLNFIGDEGEDRIVQAFGLRNYERLMRVKAAYDPDNFFRLNQNIKPAA